HRMDAAWTAELNSWHGSRKDHVVAQRQQRHFLFHWLLIRTIGAHLADTRGTIRHARACRIRTRQIGINRLSFYRNSDAGFDYLVTIRYMNGQSLHRTYAESGTYLLRMYCLFVMDLDFTVD